MFACVECLLGTYVLKGGQVVFSYPPLIRVGRICIERLYVGLNIELFVQTFQQGIFFFPTFEFNKYIIKSGKRKSLQEALS